MIGIALLIYFTTLYKAEANVTEYICNCCYTRFPQREVADVKGFEYFCLYLASVIKYPDICFLVSLQRVLLWFFPFILSSLGKYFSCYLFTYCIIYFFPPWAGDWMLDLAPDEGILRLRYFLIPVWLIYMYLFINEVDYFSNYISQILFVLNWTFHIPWSSEWICYHLDSLVICNDAKKEILKLFPMLTIV